MKITRRQTPPTDSDKPKKKRIPAIAIALFAAVVGGVSLVASLEKLNTPTPADPPAAEAGVSTTRPKSTTSRRTTVTTTRTTAPTEADAPLYVLPLSNNVVTPYAEAPVWNETLQSYRAHQAVDFGGEVGDRVVAIANATVIETGQDPLWGGILVLDCGYGVVARYCGVTTELANGDTVRVGETVGTLSGVPCESADGCCLHVEMTADGQPVDAVKAIEK